MSLHLPFILPLKFVEVAPQQVVQYVSRHMDDYLLHNRWTRWQYGYYHNKWLRSDSIALQLQTNTGQPTITVIQCDGTVVIGPQLMIQRQQNPYDPGTFIYESATALNACQDGGVYWFKITTGSITLISEPIQVFEQLTESLLVQYKHRRFYEDVIWETGVEMNLRVPAIIRYKPPAAKDTVYEDQVLDMTMIKSIPYRVVDFVVGTGSNIPDYMIDILNRILGCSSVRIDGRYYAKNEGFKWEDPDDEMNALFKGYRGELRENINRASKIVEPATNTNEEVTIIGLVDLKGFADTSEAASSNLVTFEDIE